MLDIHSLSVQVEHKIILKQLELTIKPGEIHAIMGPNGSGKSTLASTLAGHPAYEVLDGSKVALDSEPLLNLSADERARRGLFLAFQSPIEVSGVSVNNFLRAAWEAHYGPIHSPAKGDPVPTNTNAPFANVIAFREYIQQLAHELDIKPELLQRDLNEGFSGGERKRLEVLQLLLLKPKYAILDETDSGLDIDAIQVVATGAKRAAQEHQTGMMVITHYQRILQFLQPDRVHIMVDGQIVASGDASLAEELEQTGYQPWLSSSLPSDPRKE